MHEGWTLLAALAARTTRLRLGLLVTSNRIRPPALLAKIAAEVDVVSGGRLVLGIGAGSRTSVPWARREYDAHGLPYVSAAEAVGSLAEACTIIGRLWSEDEPFDFAGQHHQLVGAFCNPKPVQSPPPILIGGRGPRVLRVAAEHARIWNVPGPPANGLDELRDLNRQLDERCAAIGRDPAEIVRSTVIGVSFDDPEPAVRNARELLDIGFGHVVFSLPPPYPAGAARYVADEIIAPLGRG